MVFCFSNHFTKLNSSGHQEKTKDKSIKQMKPIQLGIEMKALDFITYIQKKKRTEKANKIFVPSGGLQKYMQKKYYKVLLKQPFT
jgi:hypothetical protein